MTTPSKLDEARLRELREAVTFGNTWKARKGANTHFFDAHVQAGAFKCVAFADRDVADFIVAAHQQIPALLDALSAERERADRAEWRLINEAPKNGAWIEAWDEKHLWRDRPPVCVVRWEEKRFADHLAMTYSNLTHFRPLPKPPLATQKAEGAET